MTRENGKRTRKPRTRFSPAQLRALRDASQKTLSPGGATIRSLASETRLDIHVIRVWFKNQRAKRKRMNLERGSLPAPQRLAGNEIQLEVSEVPWASSTQGIDEFIQMYSVPRDDDFTGLDQYLLPSASR
ncbi:paired-like homeodomain transcription factor LEUTX [Sorex fumeus]|uniref:paired-like homeodomain transcription factor LEUTX n=1 Tax=Sorex fumeus TaxID=62283 RepID=UPI0024ACA856|nr:paired-like homeodomain transcription factor LEUTX [Sorex fumeus]